MLKLTRPFLVYYLYRLGGAILPRMPASVGYALCNLAAWLAWRFGDNLRANVQNNLQHILGNGASPAELARRSRDTLRYLSYNYFDLFRLPHLKKAEVERFVRIEGWEHVETAMAARRGLVMTSAHFGNIEIVLYAMLLRGLSITIPVERVQPPELFEYITTLRMSRGLKLIPIDGPLLEMYRALRRGGVLGVAADRDLTQSGGMFDFFDAPARLPDGHVRLALRTGAPLVLGFSRRLPDFTYFAYFLPPFYLPKEGSEEERITAGMHYVLRQLEEAIRRAPEQWVVTTPVWANN